MPLSTITVIGNLTDDPSLYYFEKNQSSKVQFRVANSRRILNNNNEWTDADTMFISVEAWGQLAINCKKSLGKGMPVIVTGQLVTHQWQDDKTKENRSRMILKGMSVGLDLNRYVIGSQKSNVAEKNDIGAEIPARGNDESLYEKTYPDTSGEADGSGPSAFGSYSSFTESGAPAPVGAQPSGAQSSGAQPSNERKEEKAPF